MHASQPMAWDPKWAFDDFERGSRPAKEVELYIAGPVAAAGNDI